MKSVLSLAVLATTLLSTAECTKRTNFFGPVTGKHDSHAASQVNLTQTISMKYESNRTADNSHVNVTHTMRYPSVMLEGIAAVSNVDCSADSVVVKFNDSTVFATAQAAWSADSRGGPFVLVTNHEGDCDAELERGFFLARSVTFNNATLVATASSTSANISTIAETTELTLGAMPATALARRALVLDPSYTLNTTLALPSATTLYSYSPYLTVVADEASFIAAVTFSGYFRYSYLQFKVTDFYFDIDASYNASLGLTATIAASYNTTFTYAPATLSYDAISVPGILELGPELKFSVAALVAASAEVDITVDADVYLPDGNIHLNLLSSNLTTANWVPTYSVSATVSGEVVAQINPTASLTIELVIKILGGLIDLSTGITATPGFTNTFTLTGGEGVDLTGVSALNSSGTCSDGLEIDSAFTFNIYAFATQWWSATVYKVTVPIIDKCYSWVKVENSTSTGTGSELTTGSGSAGNVSSASPETVYVTVTARAAATATVVLTTTASAAVCTSA